MSRYVDISPYEKCRIVSNPEDNGFPVSELPTVDAEPVRHGHWVAKKVMARTPFAINHYCSKCKFETDFCTNYCSNCGAKMDKEVEHEAD